MGTPSNYPDRIEISTFTTVCVVLTVLLVALAVMAIVLLIVYFKNGNKIKSIQRLLKIDEEEQNLLLNYRNLNSNDKAIVDNMIKTLNKNKQLQQTQKQQTEE